MNDTRSEPSDEELLQRMRRKSEDFSSARDAWGLFFKRHVQFLYRCVLSADRVLAGCGIGTDDIVEETLSKLWKSGSHSFHVPEELDPDEATLRCRAWLVKIAHNLIRDKLRSRKLELVDPDENEEIFAAAEAVGPVEQSLEIYQRVTRTLSERDAAIVWFKIQHYNPDTGQSQPPREVLDAFCKEWGITPNVLRKAYGRALKHLGQAYTITPR